MTYCIGMLLDVGLIMMADTRTNAGVDNVSTFKKLHIYESEDRYITIATAGNLSVTQSTLAKLDEGIKNPESEEIENLYTVPTMFRAAELVGKVLRNTQLQIKAGYEAEGISFGATMLVGGRIGDGDLKLFMVYDVGNSISCGQETPYLQIGEFKYGKPILDRALTYETHFNEAVKLGLISFDSTMRSNLAVGLPIDITILPRDNRIKPSNYRIEKNDPYFQSVSRAWGIKLREAQESIPSPPFITIK